MALPARQQRVHTVIIPTGSLSLLVASATIAEVINVPQITPVPFSPDWFLGVVEWRNQVIPVVSFDALGDGAPPPPTVRSKIVIFYPIRGCREWEFFSLLSSAEPQPYTVDETTTEISDSAIRDNPFISSVLDCDNTAVAIPDMNALKAVFYPER